MDSQRKGKNSSTLTGLLSFHNSNLQLMIFINQINDLSEPHEYNKESSESSNYKLYLLYFQYSDIFWLVTTLGKDGNSIKVNSKENSENRINLSRTHTGSHHLTDHLGNI